MSSEIKKRVLLIAAIALCVALVVTGTAIALTSSGNADGDIPGNADVGIPGNTDGGIPGISVTPSPAILGCYVFDKNLYTNPLSSFMAHGGLPIVYGFDETRVIIANTDSGIVRSYDVEYFKTPVGADEFSSMTDFLPDWLPDISGYKERYLLAIISDESGSDSRLYSMDGEIWLTENSDIGVWTIHRLKRTDATTMADMERAYALHGGEPSYASWPAVYENQMTIKDVYALARRGDALTLEDFEPFTYMLTGVDFTVRRYDVVYADTVFVTVAPDGSIRSAELWSRRTIDRSMTVDLLDGFKAVAKYSAPTHRYGSSWI